MTLAPALAALLVAVAAPAHAGSAAPRARVVGDRVAPDAALVVDVYTHGAASVRVTAAGTYIPVAEVHVWYAIDTAPEGQGRLHLYRPMRGDWPAGAVLDVATRPDDGDPWSSVPVAVAKIKDAGPPVVDADGFLRSQEQKTFDEPIVGTRTFRFLHVAPVADEGPLVRVTLELVPAGSALDRLFGGGAVTELDTVLRSGQAEVIPLPPQDPVCVKAITLEDTAGHVVTLTPKACR